MKKILLISILLISILPLPACKMIDGETRFYSDGYVQGFADGYRAKELEIKLEQEYQPE